MNHVRQVYNADYFSGANITIAMGPAILTQAFGVSWQVDQLKRPIYGYNSQYYDAIAKGIVQVNGSLYLNFVSPRYLTVTIHRFHQMMQTWQNIVSTTTSTARVNQLSDYLQTNASAMNLFTLIGSMLNTPEAILQLLGTESLPLFNQSRPWSYQIPVTGEDPGDSSVSASPERIYRNQQAPRDFGTLLEDFYSSDEAVSGITELLWGDNSSLINDPGGEFNTSISEARVNGQWSLSEIARDSGDPFDMTSSYGRPDQIGHPMDGTQGVDITILYGNAFEAQVTNTTFQYDHSTSRIIKGVHFLGESSSVVANDEPLLDVYPFLARSVHPFTGQASRSVSSSGATEMGDHVVRSSNLA